MFLNPLGPWDPGNPPSFCKHVSSSLRNLSSSSRRSLSSLAQTTSSSQGFSDTINAFERQSMDSNEDFWPCFLILWDPGNPASFCKQVSSCLRNLSSSSRRSLSSLRQRTSSRKIEIDCRFTDKNNTFETQISEAKPRPQTKTFCSCFLILWDPGTLGIHPLSANMSPLPCGTSPPLEAEPLLLGANDFKFTGI